MMELHDPMLTDAATTQYWEVGGHPNFLLSVDERVIAARERLSQVADTSLTVLLCGERGRRQGDGGAGDPRALRPPRRSPS